MIVCDRYVFVHLHKSGGTFINELMLRCIPGAHRIGYHLPYRELPEAYRALPVLGTVRNPWAYYVSWFAFQSGQKRPNPLFRICSDDGRLGFDGTIRNLVGLGSNPSHLDAFRALVPDEYRAFGLNLTRRCVDDLRGFDGGYYGFLYARMYAGARAPTLMKLEALRPVFREKLAQLGVLPNDAVELFLDRAPALNASRHRPYREYYSRDLQRIVEVADADVIEAHEYCF